MKTLLESDFGYMTILAAKASKDALLRGFTTCRDAGGNVFGVKKATDEGLIEGPRLYPAGPLICQTAGHFDFRSYTAVPTNPCEPLDYMQRVGACLVADGQAEVLKRTREALRMGATQIKIAGGGGVSSIYDPIDVQEFTEEEVKAAVAAASAWNTYVCAHIFTDKAIRMCVEAGVTSIEHGLFATKETLQLMKEKGAWLSFQPVMNDEDAIPFPPGSEQQKKFEFVTEQTYNCARKCKEVGVNMAWGTDVLFDPQLAAKQGKLVAKMTKLGFSPYETLKMVTSNNAKLCKMCNERDPYPHEFGVVKVGAYADLLVVEGNPLDDISLVANAEENFSAIMKDGKLHKNLFK